MKLANFEKTAVTVAFAVSVACIPAVAGSGMTSAGTLIIASENNGGSKFFKVSVHSGLAGYYGLFDADGMPPGEVCTDPFANRVVAYRFWNVPKENTIGTLAQSGKIIGDLQASATTVTTGSALKLWETTYPNGSAFSTPADFTTNTSVADMLDASGSIDISNMTQGSIYFIYGAYRSRPKFTVLMGGSGTAADVNLGDIHNGDLANNNEFYLARVDFVNENGYKAVKWAMPSGANYRFSGIVVTALPRKGP